MRRLRRPLSWLVLGLSALVHIVIVAAILLQRSTPPVEDGLGAPSVSVMLTPDAEMPASPTPTPEAALGQKDAPMVQRDRAPEAASAPSAAESPPVPPPPSPGATSTPDVAAAKPPPAVNVPPPPAPPPAPSRPSAVADATAPPSARPILPTPPAPQPPAQVPPRPQAPVPPPVREALLQPRLPRLVEPPQTSPATPAPSRPARPFVPTRPAPRQPENPSGFPSPMFSSLGGTFGQPAARPTAPSREMPGPVRASSSSAFRPQYDLSGDDLGPGWERQFSDWVNAHKFYPREAAQNDEEGDVAVKLVISHTGQVMGVTLLQRSGSQWLDEALQALFRSQRLPPLPESYGSGPATENVLMHYILIHR